MHVPTATSKGAPAMGRKLRDVLATLPQDRRERIARQGDQILEEIDTLAELRRRAGEPQRAVAERLGISQPAVSKLEHQTDMTLSALESYVGTLGGSVRIVIEVPGRTPVTLRSLRDLNDEVPPDPTDRT
jgi:DNA-binding XRE family transcriptional regulator